MAAPWTFPLGGYFSGCVRASLIRSRSSFSSGDVTEATKFVGSAFSMLLPGDVVPEHPAVSPDDDDAVAHGEDESVGFAVERDLRSAVAEGVGDVVAGDVVSEGLAVSSDDQDPTAHRYDESIVVAIEGIGERCGHGRILSGGRGSVAVSKPIISVLCRRSTFARVDRANQPRRYADLRIVHRWAANAVPDGRPAHVGHLILPARGTG